MKNRKRDRRPLRVRLDVQPSDLAEIVDIFAQRRRSTWSTWSTWSW